MKCPRDLLLLFLVTSLFSCGSLPNIDLGPNEFRVSGTINNLDSDFMFFDGRDEKGDRFFDTIYVNNEQFEYIGKVYKSSFVNIWPQVDRIEKKVSSGGMIPSPAVKLQFFAEAGDDITFRGEITDYVNAYPTGSSSNDDLAILNNTIYPYLSAAADLTVSSFEIPEANVLEKEANDASIDSIYNIVTNEKTAFVNANLESTAAAWTLLDMIIRSDVTSEESVQLYDKLDHSKLIDNEFYKSLSTRIEGIKLTEIGASVPDVTSINVLTGDLFEISKQKGKYILIDFWGTWCGPCVAEMPTIKAYQAKYKDDLLVVGINSGDSNKKIKDFVAENAYDWIQLSTKDGNLVEQFAVAGFPTKFIIDPEGKIIYRYLGSGEEAFELLDEMLGDNT